MSKNRGGGPLSTEVTKVHSRQIHTQTRQVSSTVLRTETSQRLKAMKSQLNVNKRKRMSSDPQVVPVGYETAKDRRISQQMGRDSGDAYALSDKETGFMPASDVPILERNVNELRRAMVLKEIFGAPKGRRNTMR